MYDPLILLTLAMILMPLLGALLAGFFGKKCGQAFTHSITIFLVALSFLIACYLFKLIVLDQQASSAQVLYNWVSAESYQFQVSLLLDRLSAAMGVIVLFVSLMVHIYTIAYMADDPGYARFFSYMSLFTFSMLMLVFANDFLLLFFGWEGVGLVSYLLIGFWFKREKAVFGSLKAFIANRIGDVGFILAMACILKFFGTLSYQNVFQQAASVSQTSIALLPNYDVPVVTLICVLLFIGAMGKSAQMPLHVWLPESMEGPTPISALIHAATMVTAGIYMVARMSPLFEYSETALTLILILGGTTAFFTGLVAITQHDIKRVIAYSTLSQLGYMTVALGASAYNAAIFHLMMHAFFKALLFLSAGSVIIALHHEQDMRKMGGLASYLPITYLTFVVGSLALSAIPPFSGFYSKDMIIESVSYSTIPGASYAYYCVLLAAFITPLYIFRALFLTFHTSFRGEPNQLRQIKESPWVILVPLIGLAVPSIIAGQLLINPFLFSSPGLLGNSIFVLPQHNTIAQVARHYPGINLMALEAGKTIPFWLAVAGILTAWWFIAYSPRWSIIFKNRFSVVYRILVEKYGFDDFNQIVLVRGIQKLGHFCYDLSDVKIIDDVFVNGSGKLVRFFARSSRRIQTGYLYHYAFAMVLGIVVMLLFYVNPWQTQIRPAPGLSAVFTEKQTMVPLASNNFKIREIS